MLKWIPPSVLLDQKDRYSISPLAAVAGVIAVFALVSMVAATITWMTAPIQIVHRHSSPQRTAESSIEVMDHGQSFYVTPRQKRRLDQVRRRVPIVWFAGFAYLFLFFGFGGFEALRGPRPPSESDQSGSGCAKDV